jgi:alpha-1,2-mannosyltransferase
VTAWRSLAARVGGSTVPMLAAAYALSAGLFCLLLARGTAHFLDLQVYRMGGHAVLHGANLYTLRDFGLLFTYPPFAAVLFAGIAPLPLVLSAVLLTAGGIVALPVALYLALRLPPAASWLDGRAAWRLALAAAVVAVWLEPVRTTLTYGQINLFLVVAVLYDLRLPDSSRWKGLAIGIAAGFKLTPAIFAIYYLATRRYRAAATSGAAMAASVALGFAVLPASSERYWGGLFLSTSRVGQLQAGANESLAGALARTLHSPVVTTAWLPLAVAVAVAGLALAALAQRRGGEAAGYSLCAITGLLISPVSWTHHWVIAVPALLLGVVAAYRARARLTGKLALAAAAALALIGWTRLARLVPPHGYLHLNAVGILANELYVLAALATLLAAGWLIARAGGTRPPGDGAAADVPAGHTADVGAGPDR